MKIKVAVKYRNHFMPINVSNGIYISQKDCSQELFFLIILGYSKNGLI